MNETISDMQRVLRGRRVIDLTQNVAGPYCTQILGDMGAEIIKVERPGTGDDTRAWMPPVWGDSSPTFLALNRNKKSLCVDLDSVEGQELIARLAKDGDIFVHSMKPGSAEARGLGYEALRTANPKLVYCAISAFGSTGPMSGMPGYDPLIQAFTGIMSVTGSEGDAPSRVGVSLIDMGAGMWAAMGILAALLEVEHNGAGSCVGASLLETGIAWMTVFVANYRASGVLPRKLGSAVAMTAPYEVFAAADGWVFIAAGNDRLFARVCTALGLQDLVSDPRFSTNPARVRYRADLHQCIEAATACLGAAAIVEKLQVCGAPCSVLHDVSQMLSHEQVAAVGMVQPLPIDKSDDHKVVGTPFTLNGSRTSQHSAPPGLGEHATLLLTQAGYPPEAIEDLRARGVVG